MFDTLFLCVGMPLAALLYIIGQSIIIIALHSKKLQQLLSQYSVAFHRYNKLDAIFLSVLLLFISTAFPLFIIISPIVVPILVIIHLTITGVNTLAKKAAHIIDNTEIRKKDEN